MTTASHFLSDYLCYTSSPLTGLLPHCLSKWMWYIYETYIVTMRILYDTCSNKCHKFRWKFPVAPLPGRTKLYKYMKSFQATDSTLDSKRTYRRCVLRKTRKKLVLCVHWRHLQENRWLKLHSKQACLHHQHKIQINCCTCIHTTHLWFTNSAPQTVKKDWILWTSAFLGYRWWPA